MGMPTFSLFLNAGIDLERQHSEIVGVPDWVCDGTDYGRAVVLHVPNKQLLLLIRKRVINRLSDLGELIVSQAAHHGQNARRIGRIYSASVPFPVSAAPGAPTGISRSIAAVRSTSPSHDASACSSNSPHGFCLSGSVGGPRSVHHEHVVDVGADPLRDAADDFKTRMVLGHVQPVVRRLRVLAVRLLDQAKSVPILVNGITSQTVAHLRSVVALHPQVEHRALVSIGREDLKTAVHDWNSGPRPRLCSGYWSQVKALRLAE